MSCTSIVVSTFPKNALEEVRVSLEQWKGRKLISVRVWWHKDPVDEWKPSKKGLAMSVEKLPDLIAALQKAREVIDTERPASKGETDDLDG